MDSTKVALPDSPSRSKWLAMAGLGLGVFMATLDSSIVNISMPTLTEQFHTTFAVIQWVVLSYLLVLTSLMLSVARLGDMTDKKRIYLAGLVLFTLASLLCGTSPAVSWLIGFRALQGLGATMMQALGIAMITQIFPPDERGRALGLMGGIVSVGIAVGPPTGGLLISLVGWRAIFLVNVPVGILTFLMVARFVPSLRPAQTGQRFDPAGALILLVTLSSYALGMTLGQSSGFTSPQVIALLGAAALGLAALLVVEKHVSQPMIDLNLFRALLFGVNLLMGFMAFVITSASFILPFYLELVKGYSAAQSGMMLMALPVAMGLVAPVAGGLSDRFGSRGISLIGLLVIVTGCLLTGTLNADTTPLGFILRMIPIGIGLGLFQSPNNSAIMGAAPHHRLGIASGLLSLSRTLGNTTGLPLMGAIFTSLVIAAGGALAGADVTAAAPEALVMAVAGTYRVAAVIIAVAAGLGVFAYWYDRRKALRETAQSVTSIAAVDGEDVGANGC